jgi:siroheme synthase-like protein
MTDLPGVRRPYYPVSLNVDGQACLVVGGGRVAARKARALLECGAAVTVVAPSLHQDMEALVPNLAAIERRSYRPGDPRSFRLVFTATGDPQVDAAVHRDAEAAGVWVNAADDPAHSSFILPAVHRDGALAVAVSTAGLSPALSSWLRDRLASQLGEGFGRLAELLAEARVELRRSGRGTETVDWRSLLDGPLPELVRAGELDNARATISRATTTPRQL